MYKKWINGQLSHIDYFKIENALKDMFFKIKYFEKK